jgi:hypothetical protein
MSTGQDAYDLLRQIRMDATAIQAKISDLFTILNQLQLQDTKRPECPECGLTFHTITQRDEHLYLSHDGSVPAHWLAAEANAALEEATP